MYSQIKTEMKQDRTIHEFDGDGIIQGLHNIVKVSKALQSHALTTLLIQSRIVWFATKDTISKKYDHTFKDIFQEIFDAEYKEKFEAAGIEYFYTLIDDAVARVIRSKAAISGHARTMTAML